MSMTQGMIQGFYSYARLDAEAALSGHWVERIECALESETRSFVGYRNFTIWRDRKNLLWGDDWSVEIDSALQRSDFFFCLLTPGWIQSEWCRREYTTFSENSPDGAALVIHFRDINRQDAIYMPHIHLLEQLSRHQHVKLDAGSLSVLPDRDVDSLLLEAAKDLAVLVRKRLSILGRSMQKISAHPTPNVPLDATQVAPFSGEYFVPSESGGVVTVKLTASGQAFIETRAGRIVFAIRSALLQTVVEGGRVGAQNARFGASGWRGPVAEVRLAYSAGTKHALFITAVDGGGLRGEPLVEPHQTGHVALFEVVVDRGGPLSVSGHVRVDLQAVRVFEEDTELRRPLPEEEAARRFMIGKLAKIILDKTGANQLPLHGSRGIAS